MALLAGTPMIVRVGQRLGAQAEALAVVGHAAGAAALGCTALADPDLPVRGPLRGFLVSLVDLMAAVPSVVYGLWGLFFFQANVIPVSEWISTYFAWIPIFAFVYLLPVS